MEIAARFAVAELPDPSMLPSLDLRPFHLSPLAERRRQVQVCDTEVRALLRRGYLLWVTHADGEASVTLAFARTADCSGATHTASLIEEPATGFDVRQRASWPRALDAAVEALVGTVAVQVVAEADVRRRSWVAEYRRNPIGGLSLEYGSVRAADHEEPIRELAITVEPEADPVVVTLLERRLHKVLRIDPASGSALQRVLAELNVVEPVGGYVPLQRLARRELRRSLERLRKSRPVAREGRDPEGVHKMRTATRQLRTVLQVLEAAPVFDPQRLRRIRQGLSTLARTLGEARDLDVLALHLEDFCRAQPWAAADLQAFAAHIRRARTEAQRALREESVNQRVRRQLARLDQLAARRPKWENPGEELLVRHLAGAAIWQRYEAVLAFERVMPAATPASLHQLRIACKQLRYTLELFRAALGPEVDRVLEMVVTAQDHLGAIQDHITALQRINAVQREHRNNAALAAYATARATERDRLLAAFGPLWIQLTGQDVCRRLTALVAAL